MKSNAPQTGHANRFSACVVFPTFNNGLTLVGVLQSTYAVVGLPLIVVNDGSTDSTARALQEWREHSPGVGAVIVRHPRNAGKAAALLSGFAAAVGEGYTHAVTLDTDGQLDPADIPALLKASAEKPEALILGSRLERPEGCPASNHFGRWMSNLMIRGECGLDIRDSQCGLRVYPLALMQVIRCHSERFAFESEVITRARWAGAEVIEVPVTCRYLDRKDRVSHFRPWVDTFRGIGLHFLLLIRAAAPWPHAAGARGKVSIATQRRSARLGFHRLLDWMNPLRAWRDLRAGTQSRPVVAAGLAVGAFVANLPCYGFQTILSLYFAKRLHLHPGSVVAGSLLSTPPLGPLLIAAAFYVGGFVLVGSPRGIAQLGMREGAWGEMSMKLLAAWAIGSVIVGTACMIAVFFASLAILARMPVSGERAQNHGEGKIP